MTLDEKKQVIRRFVDEVLNAHNLGALDELVTEDFVEQLPFPGQGPGREGLRYAVGIFHTAFPDLHWVIEEQVAEGDTVVTRFTMTGTHGGPFLGIPATGKTVNVWGVVLDVVRDGWFVESRIIMDTMTLMRQLGAIAGQK